MSTDTERCDVMSMDIGNSNVSPKIVETDIAYLFLLTGRLAGAIVGQITRALKL